MPQAKAIDKMTLEEMRAELDGLPKKIDEAVIRRERAYHVMREKWGTSFVNDSQFLKLYHAAEAAGSEVLWLNTRAVKLSRRVREMTSETLS